MTVLLEKTYHNRGRRTRVKPREEDLGPVHGPELPPADWFDPGLKYEGHGAPAPTPTPLPRFFNITRWLAVGITAGIATVSFVLSFATLTDVAVKAGIPANLAWLWPLTVDGTIVQATMAIVALAAQQAPRRFFWCVLTAAALVSIAGNALHSLVPGDYNPWLAAVIATVAPISLLATTHGITLLWRKSTEEIK